MIDVKRPDGRQKGRIIEIKLVGDIVEKTAQLKPVRAVGQGDREIGSCIGTLSGFRIREEAQFEAVRIKQISAESNASQNHGVDRNRPCCTGVKGEIGRPDDFFARQVGYRRAG